MGLSLNNHVYNYIYITIRVLMRHLLHREFLISREANTLWNKSYEEPMVQDSSSSMEVTNIVTNSTL